MILDRPDDMTDLDCTTSFEVFSAPQLLQYYLILLQSDRFEEAENISSQLKKICQAFNYSPVSAQDYGCQLENKKKPLEALFFYLLDLYLCVLQNDYKVFMTKALEEISKVIQDTIVKAQLSKHIVHRHIIPALIKGNKKMNDEFPEEFPDVNLNQSHLISQCQLAADDFIGCETNLREAIKIYESKFAENKRQHCNYGFCLHNLGISFLERNLFERAKDYFEKAKVALESANDYESTSEKMKWKSLNDNFINKCVSRKVTN